jgi:hypothetical protein
MEDLLVIVNGVFVRLGESMGVWWLQHDIPTFCLAAASIQHGTFICTWIFPIDLEISQLGWSPKGGEFPSCNVIQELQCVEVS